MDGVIEYPGSCGSDVSRRRVHCPRGWCWCFEGLLTEVPPRFVTKESEHRLVAERITVMSLSLHLLRKQGRPETCDGR